MPDSSDLRRGKTLHDMRDEAEDEPTQRYTLDLPKSLHRWLKDQALLVEDRSMREVTIAALEEYRETHG